MSKKPLSETEKHLQADAQRRRSEMAETDLLHDQRARRERLAQASNTSGSTASLMRKMGTISINLPTEPGELWGYAIDQMNESALCYARAGLAFLLLREQSPDGMFLKELEAREVPRRSAYNAMSVAKFLLNQPPGRQELFLTFSGSKLIEIARIPDETLEQLAKEDDLARLGSMSVRDLKQLEKENDKLRKALEDEKQGRERDNRRKQEVIDKLDKEHDRRDRLTPDERTIALLTELMMETEKAKAQLLGPEKVINQIVNSDNVPQGHIKQCAHALEQLEDAIWEIRKTYGIFPTHARPSDAEFIDIVEGRAN